MCVTFCNTIKLERRNHMRKNWIMIVGILICLGSVGFYLRNLSPIPNFYHSIAQLEEELQISTFELYDVIEYIKTKKKNSS